LRDAAFRITQALASNDCDVSNLPSRFIDPSEYLL